PATVRIWTWVKIDRARYFADRNLVCMQHCRESTERSIFDKPCEICFVRLKSMNRPSRTDAPRKLKREKPDVRADVKTNSPGRDELPATRQLLHLIESEKYRPLHIVSRVKFHAHTVDVLLDRRKAQTFAAKVHGDEWLDLHPASLEPRE